MFWQNFPLSAVGSEPESILWIRGMLPFLSWDVVLLRFGWVCSVPAGWSFSWPYLRATSPPAPGSGARESSRPAGTSTETLRRDRWEGTLAVCLCEPTTSGLVLFSLHAVVWLFLPAVILPLIRHVCDLSLTLPPLIVARTNEEGESQQVLLTSLCELTLKQESVGEFVPHKSGVKGP